MRKTILLNEWVLVIEREVKERSGRVTVRVQNAYPEDRKFARALARLAEVWFNTKRMG